MYKRTKALKNYTHRKYRTPKPEDFINRKSILVGHLEYGESYDGIRVVSTMSRYSFMELQIHSTRNSIHTPNFYVYLRSPDSKLCFCYSLPMLLIAKKKK